jgi:hypothetical protein
MYVMKFFRFLLLLPVLFISSCDKHYYTEEKKYYTEEYYTEEKYYTEEVALITQTIYYNVRSTDWKLLDVPPTPSEPEDSRWTYFYYDFSEPVLTSTIFDTGMMNAYLTDDGNKSKITPLPYDNFFKAPGSDFMWTEQVTCEFSPGKVRFIVKYNDFEVKIRPEAYTFMVRFAW